MVPDYGVLHSADVIQGECLANLYALRGATRDIGQWIAAIDMLRGFEAQALLFGHGRPVTGQDDVRELLTVYRDAMQYVHDQTIRFMARGLTPDELVDVVSGLPPRLRDHPWLGEFYGNVKQIVRQIYVNNFGWFEGDPTFLDPLSRPERSARYVAAMGGRDAVLSQAREASDNGEHQWVAEILTHIIRLDPDDSNARNLKADALRQLGFQAVNPIWRNFYLMAARELEGTLNHDRVLASIRRLANPDVLATVPIPMLLRTFVTRLDPQRSAETHLFVTMLVRDTNARYGLIVRSDVVEILPNVSDDATIEIHADENVLRALLTGRMTWRQALDDAAVALHNGAAEDAERFWSLFDPPPGDVPAIAVR